MADRMLRRRSVADATTAFVQYLNETLEQLHALWDEAGMTDDPRGERVTTVYVHLRSLLDQMVEEETGMVGTLKKRAKENLKTVKELRRELGMEDYMVPMDAELLEMDEILRSERERLKALKKQRVEKLARLKEEDETLCTRLDTVPFIVKDAIPSEQHLEELAEHVDQMRHLLHNRSIDFGLAKTELGRLLARMGTPAPNEFCKEVLRSSEETFLLSSGNMDALETLILTVSDQYKSFVANFRSRFDELYAEIDHWWTKCLVPIEERAQFPSFSEDDISEAALDRLRAEIERLRQFFSERQSVLGKLEVWQELWKEKLDFEQHQNDPARYHNRAGNLAAELKRNKAVESSLLPKARRDLEAAVEEWTVAHPEEAILICGRDPVAYVDFTVSEHLAAKEYEKQQKQLAKKQQMEQEAKFGSTPGKKASPPKRALTPCGVSRSNLTNKMTLSRARSPIKPVQLQPGQTR
uniref:Protein regulator of cytokinesis 1 n=1 Tax=Plectus sambesii TaxID=2011161 RepID=A0A914WWU3_9BILA